jgi:type II secretory pathway pseudopilin PulG
MSHNSTPRTTAAGFTLMEVLVVLATLGMILWMVGQLFFPMRQAAERQRLQVEARQTARSAVDYVAYLVRGATDLNEVAPIRNPAAILTYLWRGSNPGIAAATLATCPGDTGCVQMSFNNVNQSTTSFATDGTDVLTLSRSTAPRRISAASFPLASGSFTAASVQYWAFRDGCAPGGPAANGAGNDSNNLAFFKQVTGGVVGPAQNPPLVLINPVTGGWLVYRITDYRDASNGSSCTVPDPANCTLSGVTVPCIGVSADPQAATALNPPGGFEAIAALPDLAVGSRFASLRVCNGWLEQKDGLFDRANDATCPALPAGTVDFPPYVVKAGWSPLLPNVEDLQVAYVFSDGTVGNGPGGTVATTDGVPTSTGNNPVAGTPDIVNVIGVRITVTGRSATQVLFGGHQPGRPLACEDHPASAAAEDTFYRYQVSAIALLRNRTAGI